MINPHICRRSSGSWEGVREEAHQNVTGYLGTELMIPFSSVNEHTMILPEKNLKGYLSKKIHQKTEGSHSVALRMLAERESLRGWEPRT